MDPAWTVKQDKLDGLFYANVIDWYSLFYNTQRPRYNIRFCNKRLQTEDIVNEGIQETNNNNVPYK